MRMRVRGAVRRPHARVADWLAGAPVAVPTRGDVAATRSEAAGALELQPVLALADGDSLCPRLRLSLLQPESLAEHPLGGDGPFATTVEPQRRVAAPEAQDLVRLRRRARVHP